MKILLVGCGKIGFSHVGWLEKAGIKDVQVIDPALGKTIEDLPKRFKPDYIVLAIKPQEMANVLPSLSAMDGVVISIAAGKKISFIQKHMGIRHVVRAMPNLPAILGQGVTGAVMSKPLSFDRKKEVDKILSAFGKLVWVKKESDIDSITAISGSGPAYLFLFAEGMVEAAKKFGFTTQQARDLVFSTIKGSVNMAEGSKLELSELISNVASKGGTTEAALKVFKAKNFKKTIAMAAGAAKKRSIQLSGK